MKILNRILNILKGKNFLCGIGDSEILTATIKIKNYPFKPSIVYPNRIIHASEIDSISWESHPPLIRINDECIIVSREYSDELKHFCIHNNIKTFKANSNWEWILEPYLDTEYTEETNTRLNKLLSENGISNEEVMNLRKEVKEQMLIYNFDTMLWEWISLGLADVLAAMRAKYSDEQFEDFYMRAMEIQLRNMKCDT